jgi:hypothetical protein
VEIPVTFSAEGGFELTFRSPAEIFQRGAKLPDPSFGCTRPKLLTNDLCGVEDIPKGHLARQNLNKVEAKSAATLGIREQVGQGIDLVVKPAETTTAGFWVVTGRGKLGVRSPNHRA